MSSDATRGSRNSSRLPSDGLGSENAHISEDVALLSRLVHELENQLRRLGSMNEALEHDLATERARSADLERHVAQVEKSIAAIDESGAGQGLLPSISRASTERAELVNQSRLLQRQLSELSKRRGSQERQSRGVREQLAEAELELQTVESQLERVLATVAAVELQVKAAALEQERLRDEVRTAEERVQAVKRERNALAAEVADSRVALQELQGGLSERL